MKVESERDLSESFVKLGRSQKCGVFSTMNRLAVLGKCRKAYCLGCTWPSEGLLPHADLVPRGAIFLKSKIDISSFRTKTRHQGSSSTKPSLRFCVEKLINISSYTEAHT